MRRTRAIIVGIGAAGIVLSGVLAGARTAQADATVTCPFQGKQVQTVIANTKDAPRSCNAVCVWRYGDIALRGAGGAMLQSGESKSVYHSIAPYPIDALLGSDINCNR
jgi:hypothetical protein